MIFKDYYRILELSGPKVNIDEIKIAYREQAKKYHPDVNVGNKKSEERFKDINEAYRVLSDTSSKKKYDRMWNSNIGRKKVKEEEKQTETEKGSVVKQFLKMLFKGIGDKDIGFSKRGSKNETAPLKGENIDTEVNISLEEGFFGTEKKISLRMVNGKMKTFNIKIPAGIRNGEKIRLLGQGKKGQNGGKNGDLFIRINVENNAIYTLNGYDIYVDLLLTPWEAVLGTKVEMDTIDEKITVTVPRGTETGDMLSIPNKGYRKQNGERGNLLAQVKIMIPKEITDKEKKLFMELSKISTYKPRKIYG